MATGTLDPSTPLQYQPPAGGYMTPDAIKSLYEYAKALQSSPAKEGGGQQFPIISPWQGASNIVNALVGGYEANQANQAGLAGVTRAMQQRPAITNTPGQSDVLSGLDPASPEGADMPKGGSNAKASAVVESGGDYNAVGPDVKRKDGSVDRAYGIHQVMGANIPSWTKEVLGKSLTPDEFLNNPKAQDAVYAAKRGQLEAKYGPQGAARAWFAGEGGMNNPNAKDVLGTTVAGYERKFDKAAGLPQSALAFNGSPADSMALALNGGKAQTPLKTAQLPEGQQAPLIDPRLVAPRPKVGEGQFRDPVGHLFSTPEDRNALSSMYYNQNQPQTMPYLGGNVLISPSDPRVQQYLPHIEKGEIKAGDATAPIFTTPLPPAKTGGMPSIGIMPMQGAQPGAAQPAQPGAAQPQGAVPNLLKFQGESGQPEIPNITTAPAQPGTFPTVGGDKKVETPLNADQPQTASAMAFAPADAGGDAVSLPKAPDTAGKVAQNYIPPALQGMMGELQTIGAEGRRKTEQAAKEADTFSKKYDNLSQAGQIATKSIPELEMAKKIVNDPRFISGIGGQLRLDLAKLKSFVGIDPDAAAATEVFQKIISKGIVQDLKTQLQGLGQIRLAEINLMSQATGNIYATPQANEAVLNIVINAQKQIAGLSQMANHYAQGIRWDEKGTPVQTANRGLDYGWDQTAQRYLDAHPVVTKEQKAAYEKAIRSDPNYKEENVRSTAKTYEDALLGRSTTETAPAEIPKSTPEGQAAPKAAILPPKEAIDKLRTDPSLSDKFDHIFGPGAAKKALGQ